MSLSQDLKNTLQQFLESAKSRNIAFYVEDGQLCSSATKGAIVQSDRVFVKAHKAQLIDYLEQAQHKFAPLSDAEKQTGVAVSFSQQRLWLLDQLQGGSPEYNMPIAFDVHGQLDLSLLNEVFTEIIARHEVLRTVYFEAHGEAKQRVCSLSELDFSISLEDLSTHEQGNIAQRVKDKVRADIQAPFDLSKDVMLRVSYLRTAHDTGVLLFNMHHIATDGWSIEVLVKEFFTLYDAFAKGQTNPLPALPIQYSQYAHWQRTQLEGDVLDGQFAYWQKQLADLPAVHSLPLSRSRTDLTQRVGATVNRHLPAKVSKQLVALAKQYQITPFMLLHGALSLLLSRHSNSADIVIGTPIANRLHEELTPLIGFFVNTLVLRVDTGYCTLPEYFEHIKQVHVDAQENQDMPFEQLVERLNVPRSTAHTPLFQIVMSTNTDFGFEKNDSLATQLAGIGFTPYSSEETQARFDLDIIFNIKESGLGVFWTYDAALFDAAFIEQLNDHLCRLLTGLSELTCLDAELRSLPMLSASEVTHLTSVLDGDKTPYPKQLCIHELFEQQASAHPDKLALVFEQAQWTYQALNARANQLAHRLVETQHVTPNTLIGICSERSVQMLIGILGVLKAGGAYVPLDPSYPQARLDHMINDAALNTIVSYGQVEASVAGFSGQIISLDDDAGLDDYGTDNLCKSRLGLTSSDLAYVIYTSGSTGQPKGVTLAHQGAVNLAHFQHTRYALNAHSRVLMYASYGFDAATSEWMMALTRGGTLYLCNEDTRISTAMLSDYLLQHQISHATLPPVLLQHLELRNDYSLECLLVAGEACDPEQAARWSQQYRLVNAYGPTETTVCASAGDVNEGRVVLGKAVDNMSLYVMTQQGQLTPQGCPGELYIAGDGLARGYLNQPELTEQSFVYSDIPELAGKRLYKSGDVVKLEQDNQLTYIGRVGTQISLRGYRIEPAEIESQLAQLEGVQSAVVNVLEQDTHAKQLIAYIVADDSADFDEQKLKKELGLSVPQYMVPSRILSVPEWPLTRHGKIDKAVLPTPDLTSLQNHYVAPSNELEIQLVEIWAEVLKLPANEISITADFFELGGNSLLATSVVTKLQEIEKVQLSMVLLFDYQTIDALAAWLEVQRSIRNLQDAMQDSELEEDFF